MACLPSQQPRLGLPFCAAGDDNCGFLCHSALIMARKKTSAFEDIIDIAAQLPWKIGVVLAIVAYLILHYFATRAPLPTNPAELKSLGKTIGESVGQSLTTTLATFLQYIIPIGLLIGALVSFIKRKRQKSLHAQVAVDRSSNALEKMSWREFEGLVAETFRRQGYRVVECGGDGPDGGVDLELYQGNDKYLVQCKQWKSSKVGVAIVRELFGVMSAEHAVGGFVVASGDFTEEARAFAEGRSIRLIDARRLRTLIATSDAAPAMLGRAEPRKLPERQIDAAPACPKCGSPMVQRVAKTGVNTGRTFWGCSTFPACRGIRN